MRTRLVAGNWKMNGRLAANAQLLAALVRGAPEPARVRCAVCVPFPYLGQVRELLGATRIEWGAQSLSEHASGAYTGEVSAAMLSDFGCRYVIVGHSERRTLYGETDELVAAKFEAAADAGLTPILCVVETLAQRDAGDTESVVARQLDAVLQRCGVRALRAAVIAYEPVWAIGTGRTASPEQAQAVHAFLRARLGAHDAATGNAVPLLYGGSVKAANARELFAQPDIDGGLVGGASLVAEEFLAICRAAER